MVLVLLNYYFYLKRGYGFLRGSLQSFRYLLLPACLPLVSPISSTSIGAVVDLGRIEDHALESLKPLHRVQLGGVPSISLGLLTASLSLASGT